MSLIQSNPFGELESIHARLNRLFTEAPPATSPADESCGNWEPPLDIEETDRQFAVTLDLPDVKKENIKVELKNGVLSIEGSRTLDQTDTGKTYHRIERQYGQFVRWFMVPSVVDGSAIAAEFNNGVLKVTLPKSAVKPTTVDVKVAS